MKLKTFYKKFINCGISVVRITSDGRDTLFHGHIGHCPEKYMKMSVFHITSAIDRQYGCALIIYVKE